MTISRSTGSVTPDVNPEVASPRRRGRPAAGAVGAVSEQDLLDLAFQTFAQHGYEATTLRSLAKRLGVSHNLLHVRFGAKADLWRRAVDARVARIQPQVFAIFGRDDLSDQLRLHELLYQFCRWAAQNPDFVSLSFIEGRRPSWRLDHLVEAHIRPFKQRLDDLWSRVAAAHDAPELSTMALMALLVEGVGFYFASAPMRVRLEAAARITPTQIDRQCRMFADLLLAGLVRASRHHPATCPRLGTHPAEAV
jgi:AcrR family transcriptional regulator